MAVPTIALYASPPSSVCSSAHHINAHVSYDFELNSRTSTSPSTTTIGGLSYLFSSPSARYSCGDEEAKELSCVYSYSPSKFGRPSLKWDHSPVSVLNPPVSCSSSSGSTRSKVKGADVNIHTSGLFNGFVRNALGSCIDYDSTKIKVESCSPELADELMFNMEDGFVEGDRDQSVKDLLMNAQLRHKIFLEEIVVKAFYEAERAHRGQMRASGDPYLQHCVETAVLLASIGASSSVVAAGLLHDTLDDSFMSYDYIFKTFGAGVANLVEGVSKLSQLSELARQNDTAYKSVEADRLHTMFLAMADARAVLIKLADRSHNMMTLESLPLISKRHRFAKETLEIFVPLANRLGISTWKEQLENLCFKHLYPEQHSMLSSKLDESFDEAVITSATGKLEEALKDKAISYNFISGRHKSLYSIYKKMLKKSLSVNEIHDIHGLRVVVNNVEDCYKALEVIHGLWTPVPGKVKDYISDPKFNGYQSLHTVVMDDGMASLEVQIRTKEMHLQAEFGFAAHWRYKEGDSQHSSFVLQMVEWARWVLTWQCETMSKDPSSICFSDSIKPQCMFPKHSKDCPYSYKHHCQEEGPVFVILIENDKKMSVQEFPANSSLQDLVERIERARLRWSSYGFPVKEESRLRLNHKPVSDTECKLKMGDVVELSRTIIEKSWTVYRNEIQRMYDRDLAVSRSAPAYARRS